MQTLSTLNTASAANTAPTIPDVQHLEGEGANVFLRLPAWYPIHDFGNTLTGNGIVITHDLLAPDSACYLEWPTPQFPQWQGTGNGNVTITVVSSITGSRSITISGIRTAEDYFEADCYLDFPPDYFGSGNTAIGFGQGNIVTRVSQPSTAFFMTYGQRVRLEDLDEWANIPLSNWQFAYFGNNSRMPNNSSQLGNIASWNVVTALPANSVPQIADLESPPGTIYTLTVSTQDVAGRFEVTGNTELANTVQAEFVYQSDANRDGVLRVTGTRDLVNAYIRDLSVVVTGGTVEYPPPATSSGAFLGSHPIQQGRAGNLNQFWYIGPTYQADVNLQGGFSLIDTDAPYANAGSNRTLWFDHSLPEQDLGILASGATVTGRNQFLSCRSFNASGRPNLGLRTAGGGDLGNWDSTSDYLWRVGTTAQPGYDNSWCHEAWIKNESTWDATIYYYQGLPWSIVNNRLWIGGLITSGDGGVNAGWNTAVTETVGDRLPNECGYQDSTATYTRRIEHDLPLDRDTWYHVAVVCDRGVLRLYVNGREESTYYSGGMTTCAPEDTVSWPRGPNGQTPGSVASPFIQWGGISVLWSRFTGSGYRVYQRRGWRGRLHDIRFSRYARYQQEFDPPTQPLITDANTSFLGNFRNAQVVDDASIANLDSGTRTLTYNFTSTENPVANNAITCNYSVQPQLFPPIADTAITLQTQVANRITHQAQRNGMTLAGVTATGEPVFLMHQPAPVSGVMTLRTYQQDLVTGITTARSTHLMRAANLRTNGAAAPSITQLATVYDTARVGTVPTGITRVIGAEVPTVGNVAIPGGDLGRLSARVWDYRYDAAADRVQSSSYNDFNGLPNTGTWQDLGGVNVSWYNLRNGNITGPQETHVAVSDQTVGNTAGYWHYNVGQPVDQNPNPLGQPPPAPMREYNIDTGQGANIIFGSTGANLWNVPHSSTTVIGLPDPSRQARVMLGVYGLQGNVADVYLRLNRRVVGSSQTTDNQQQVFMGGLTTVPPNFVSQTALGIANATPGNIWLVGGFSTVGRAGNTVNELGGTNFFSALCQTAANVVTVRSEQTVQPEFPPNPLWPSGRIGRMQFVSGNACTYLIWTQETTGSTWNTLPPAYGTPTGNSRNIYGRRVDVDTQGGNIQWGPPFAIGEVTNTDTIANEFAAASYVYAGNTYITVNSANAVPNAPSQIRGVRVPDAGFVAGTSLDLRGNYLRSPDIGYMAPASGYLRFACLFYHVPAASGAQGIVSLRLGTGGDWGFVFNVESNQRPRLIRVRNTGSDAGIITTSGSDAGDFLLPNAWNLVVGYLNNDAPDLSTTRLWINGSLRNITSSGTYPNPTIEFGWNTTSKRITVGNNDPAMIGGTQPLAGGRMAYVWADAGNTTPDITQFWQAGPRWLGTTGTATGLPAPLIYHQGNENTFPLGLASAYRMYSYAPILGASGPTYV